VKNKPVVKASCYDKRGRLISSAYNSFTKTHPLQAYFASLLGMPKKIYLHAEVAALLRAGKTPVHRIHIDRWGSAGQLLLAKPCPICMEAIKAYGVKLITYS